MKYILESIRLDEELLLKSNNGHVNVRCGFESHTFLFFGKMAELV